MFLTRVIFTSPSITRKEVKTVQKQQDIGGVHRAQLMELFDFKHPIVKPQAEAAPQLGGGFLLENHWVCCAGGFRELIVLSGHMPKEGREAPVYWSAKQMFLCVHESSTV